MAAVVDVEGHRRRVQGEGPAGHGDRDGGGHQALFEPAHGRQGVPGAEIAELDVGHGHPAEHLAPVAQAIAEEAQAHQEGQADGHQGGDQGDAKWLGHDCGPGIVTVTSA